MRAIDIDKGGESFGPKVRAWNDVALLEQWRALWAEHVNRALELAGESARVDHRSLEAQGIERVAGIHLGPAVVELAARGIDTERAELAREIEAINTALAEIEEPPPRASSPPVTVIALAPGHDLVRRRRSTGRGIAAAFRTAARMVWGRIRRAVRPPPARNLQHRKPKIA
jgi:hypothetical protein